MNDSQTPSKKAEYARRWRAKNKDHVRAYRRQYSRKWRARQGADYHAKDREDKRRRGVAVWLKRAGWSPEEYARRKADGCSVCGRHVRLVFDHDHDTGKVRGLLCIRCNLKLDWSIQFSTAIRHYLTGL